MSCSTTKVSQPWVQLVLGWVPISQNLGVLCVAGWLEPSHTLLCSSTTMWHEHPRALRAPLLVKGQGVCYHVYVNSAHKWTPVDQWNITIHGTPTFKQQQRHARCGSNKATRSWIYSCQNEIRLLKENPNFSVECQHMLTYNYSLFDDDIKITTYFTILNLQAIKPTLRFLPTNCEGHSSIPKWIFRHIYYQKYSNIFVPCSSFLYCFWVTVALFCPKYFHANANISSCVYIYVQYSL